MSELSRSLVLPFWLPLSESGTLRELLRIVPSSIFEWAEIGPETLVPVLYDASGRRSRYPHFWRVFDRGAQGHSNSGDHGIPTVVDQIDPGRTEDEIVRREAALWPGWTAMPGHLPDDYFARLAAEWKAASMVIVNSEWSRESLIRQGVPAESFGPASCPLCPARRGPQIVPFPPEDDPLARTSSAAKRNSIPH